MFYVLDISKHWSTVMCGEDMVFTYALCMKTVCMTQYKTCKPLVGLFLYLPMCGWKCSESLQRVILRKTLNTVRFYILESIDPKT